MKEEGQDDDGSRPSRARGLKRGKGCVALHSGQVAPFTGAWIETAKVANDTGRMQVAPFTGAWIETGIRRAYPASVYVAPFTGAWIETSQAEAEQVIDMVAPFTGAWIETGEQVVDFADVGRRALHGRVD